MRRHLVVLFLTVASTIGSMVVGIASARAVTCTVTVASGGDIEAAINANPAGSTICLATSGTYTPTLTQGTITLISSDTLTTPTTPKATINCVNIGSAGSNTDCLDAHGTTGVTISKVIVTNAPEHGVKMGDAMTLSGIKVTGSGAFGVVANQTSGDVINASSIVSNNATNCAAYGGTGFCGGIKSNQTQGMTVTSTTASSNGSNGIWFDINSRGTFSITNNTANSNAGDGIRIEISCFGTVSGNKTSMNSGAGINVVNSNHITVGKNNTVTTASGFDGITAYDSGRAVGDGGTATGDCAGTNPPGPQPTGTHYYNINNVVKNNKIAMTTTGTNETKNGFYDTSGLLGFTFSDSFTANSYTGGLCSNLDWKFYDGVSTTVVKLTFLQWQGQSQDVAGSCA